jgi:hypothetical protein
MPASIAHMLIFEEVISKIENDKGCDDLVKLLKENIKYGRLGSVGPDLPYFGILSSASLFDAVRVKMMSSDLPAGIEKWSGQMHSKDPNVFPLKMIEIAWRETDLNAEEWDDISRKQWAFIMGFLTHVAADQIVHPYVNKIVGQYYRESKNRDNHRKCEVYHDVVLFNKKRSSKILKEDLMEWVTVSKEECTEPFLRVFLQKAFIEAHSIHPTEKEIEGWVYGYMAILKYLKYFGPYKAAADDYESQKENSEQYKKYWLNDGGKPYEEFYNEAVELASLYVKTAYQLFKVNYADLEDKQRQDFLSVVRNADLTNPLDRDVLKNSRECYLKCFG